MPVATTAVDDCCGTTDQLGRMDWFMPLTRHYFPATAETARPMTAAEGPFTSWPATTWQPSKA